jgi:hypothetical protein
MSMALSVAVGAAQAGAAAINRPLNEQIRDFISALHG